MDELAGDNIAAKPHTSLTRDARARAPLPSDIPYQIERIRITEFTDQDLAAVAIELKDGRMIGTICVCASWPEALSDLINEIRHIELGEAE